MWILPNLKGNVFCKTSAYDYYGICKKGGADENNFSQILLKEYEFYEIYRTHFDTVSFNLF